MYHATVASTTPGQSRCDSPWAWILPVCLALTGCGRAGIELAPVHGTITIDEQTMPEGKVMFAPIAEGTGRNIGKPASGRVQSDGRYRLTTYRTNDGAVVGEHWVTIINSEESDELPEFARFLVRDKIRVVAGQDNQIDIHVTSKDIKRYAQDDR